MKTSVAIVLIVCGAVLIITPGVLSYLYDLNTVQHPDMITRRTQEEKQMWQAVVCWGAGVVMVGIGVVGSLWLGRRDGAAGPLAEPGAAPDRGGR
jgi:drug/metabolite transporter (DMT)-like permease